MNTLYLRTQPTMMSFIGNCLILQHARQHAEAEYNRDIQFVISDLRELSMIKIVG